MEMVHFIPPSQRRLAMLAAQADSAPVLIHGASGTGKGAIARWIHQNSPRAAKPFVVATRDTPILQQLPAAQGGTLLVSEIGELPLGEQKHLLNFLNTKSIPHAGHGSMRMLLNTRLMATTDQALDARAQGGLFKRELLEKMNVFRLEMPPLSSRTEEFEDIVLGLLTEITREIHKEHLRGIAPEAWQRLTAYPWPGNLRELRNVLRVAVITATEDTVLESDLPEFGQDRVDFRATREEFEKLYILELLKTYHWQIDETCRITRMDKSTLLGKIKKYGIAVETL